MSETRSKAVSSSDPATSGAQHIDADCTVPPDLESGRDSADTEQVTSAAQEKGKNDDLKAPRTCGDEIVDACSFSKNWEGVFHRTPGSLDCLDGVRGWAVLWVIMYHNSAVFQISPFSTFDHKETIVYRSIFAQVPLSGDFGVVMFFVLSGFLIALQCTRELEKTGGLNYFGFLWARFWRLAPAYYMAILTLMVVNIYDIRRTCMQEGWKNLLFLNGGILDGGCIMWSWSIAMEFQFYFLTPGIIRLCCRVDGQVRRHGFKALLLLGLVVQTIRMALYYQYHEGQNAPGQMVNKLWTLAHTYFCGIAACLAFRNGLLNDVPQWILSVVDIFAALLVLSLAMLGTGLDNHRWAGQHSDSLRVFLLLFSQICFAACVAWAIFRMCTGGLSCLRTFFSAPAWVPVARLSYSAYLLQFIGIAVLLPDFYPCAAVKFAPWLGFCGETVIYTFCCALVHYLIVEGPCMRLRKYLTPSCLVKA